MNWTKTVVATLAMAMIAAVSPAHAQTADFSVGSVHYTVPVPQGYCVPERPDDVARMNFAASQDARAETVLSLVQCAPDGDRLDYILVKAPKDGIDEPTTLGELMAAMGGGFDALQGTDLPMGETEQQLGQAFAAPGTSPAAFALAMGPRGRDSTCLYVGGVAHSEALDGGSVSIGGCMSSVGNRMLVVWLYTRGDSPATVRRLMLRARGIVLSMSPQH